MTSCRAPELQICQRERTVRKIPIVRLFRKSVKDLRRRSKDSDQENTDEQGHHRVGDDLGSAGIDSSGGNESFSIGDLELNDGESCRLVVVGSVGSPVEEESGGSFGVDDELSKSLGRGENVKRDIGGRSDEATVGDREDGDHGLENLGEEHRRRYFSRVSGRKERVKFEKCDGFIPQKDSRDGE